MTAPSSGKAGKTAASPPACLHAPRPHDTRRTPHTPQATCLMPQVTRHTPQATSHKPHATCHTPHAMPPTGHRPPCTAHTTQHDRSLGSLSPAFAPRDTLNKSSRRSHPRIGGIRSLACAVNSTTRRHMPPSSAPRSEARPSTGLVQSIPREPVAPHHPDIPHARHGYSRTASLHPDRCKRSYNEPQRCGD